ncbi:SUMF1/EgtB/PvdO family nonheme iron enzyme [Leptolyngbya sp. FACHB-16]|uniref:formylglycine-generating enzyme family protein n=1 Tax=unclassified Leptolyngbya TaxID=2650499 RepID=UPI0016869CFE|nr:SUMF1/EgtB/PvdO family nonheme iron enzyme [Leptolyngbya sp. FACHB-16]MBD2158113.1 SUMF1/EgtB/PvdO family nonheme iron enzyme [Leptolyngbya sp. FACHB-16]
MNITIRGLQLLRKSHRHFSLITLLTLTASLIISCASVQNRSTVSSSPIASPSQEATTAASTPALNQSMVLIPASNYTIGSDASADSRPVHQVSLRAFRIDRYEVTNAQYAEFLNSLGLQPLQDAAAGEVRDRNLPQSAVSQLIEGVEGRQQQPLIALDDEHTRIGIYNGKFVAQSGYENHPVTETTWRGASEFCRWRNTRLPTEVEWEAAARGVEGRIYPWGNEPPTTNQVVYGRASGETSPVGTHDAGASPDGIHDMAGNVAEWTSSLYRPYPYNPDDGREQLDNRGERVTRGGDHVFDSSADKLTTHFRTGFSRAPDRGHRHIGFRCAESI